MAFMERLKMRPVSGVKCCIRLSLLVAILNILLSAGCTGMEGARDSQMSFQARGETQVKGDIRVTAAVPSATEARALFGVSLYDKGIQPVWLEIENNSDSSIMFLPFGLDPQYYTPIETAILGQNRGRDPDSVNPDISRFFYERGEGMHLVPGETQTGFVFSSLDEGTKAFNVDIIAEDEQGYLFTFFVPVPGLKIDHEQVDWENLYTQEQRVHLENREELFKELEALPCCTTEKYGEDQGDPLNIIVIGEIDDVYYAFLRAGWDETETIHAGSALKTALSFVFGGEYRYSPVSGLYVFDRPQDVALQKARDNIHERNHLRLWLTPVAFRGVPVWVGQISRDIGVRFTTRTVTTHKIDPDVDETREYLLENLAYSQALVRFGYVGGVGAASMDSPRHNLTGDPYFTDGYRVVLWISSEPVNIKDIEMLQ